MRSGFGTGGREPAFEAHGGGLKSRQADARGCAGKKMVAPALRRRAAGHLVKTHGIRERRACRVMQIHRSVARYRSIARREDGPIEVRLRALALQYPRYGYLMLHHLMRAEGLVANRKRTYRIYTALGLQVRTKRRRKITRPRISMPVPDGPNQRWSSILSAIN